MTATWTRWFAIGGVVTGVLCLVFLFHYPFEPHRRFIFDYLLRKQDFAGAVLVIFIAAAAVMPGIGRTALRLVDWLTQNPWPTAAATFLALCAVNLLVTGGYPVAGDEHLVVMQSKAFAAARLSAEFPRELVSWVVPWIYLDRWLYASPVTGAVVPVYWPGYALLLAPFQALGIPWAANPLLVSGSLLLMATVAARLTGTPQAAGWATLFALASPAFTGMALSYFSMSAHLFMNLAYAALLIERSPRRLFFAGVVGSLALILSNPVPHLLFAAPWVLWIAWREGRRSVLPLLAGYVPVGLAVLGWWVYVREVQGHVWYAPYPGDGDLAHRFGNFLFFWQVQFNRVFVEPGLFTLGKRAAEQVKLWLWTVPGLPALAIAGFVLCWREVQLRLLGLSYACTVLGFLTVWFDQGYGWGVRYLHPAFGALPVLAAGAVVALRHVAARESLQRYAASAALLSLVLATSLRLVQIHQFVDEHLSRRPPFEAGARQIVFVTLNYDYYTQDFVQNDPFLRAPVIFMLSRGRARDEAMLRALYPGARLVREAPFGHVWRLD